MSETRLVTAEEFERMPDDPVNRYELVEGRLVRTSPVSFDHGRIVVRLIVLLQRHLDEAPVGAIAADVGFKLASNPDTVRGPVAVVSVVDPRKETVTSYRPAGSVTLRDEHDLLDLSDVIPGFRCSLREIFE